MDSLFYPKDYDDYDGAEGVRNFGALETTIYRPQSGYYAHIIAQRQPLYKKACRKRQHKSPIKTS